MVQTRVKALLQARRRSSRAREAWEGDTRMTDELQAAEDVARDRYEVAVRVRVLNMLWNSPHGAKDDDLVALIAARDQYRATVAARVSAESRARIEVLEAALEDVTMGLAIFGHENEQGEVAAAIERARAVFTSELVEDGEA